MSYQEMKYQEAVLFGQDVLLAWERGTDIPEDMFSYEAAREENQTVLKRAAGMQYIFSVISAQEIDLGPERKKYISAGDITYGQESALEQYMEMWRAEQEETKEAPVVEMKSGADMYAYHEEHEKTFDLSKDDCEMLYRYMAAHDYDIGCREEQLVVRDNAEGSDVHLYLVMEMDAVIDLVCEQNYEMQIMAKRDLLHAPSLGKGQHRKAMLNSLQADGKRLDTLYAQTRYQMEVKDIARAVVAEAGKSYPSRTEADKRTFPSAGKVR